MKSLNLVLQSMQPEALSIQYRRRGHSLKDWLRRPTKSTQPVNTRENTIYQRKILVLELKEQSADEKLKQVKFLSQIQLDSKRLNVTWGENK